MTKLRLSLKIIQAAATDAGNRSMRRAGRTAWNIDDWNEACSVRQELLAVWTFQSGTQVDYVNSRVAALQERNP